MKFVVPFTMPSTRCTFVTMSDSRRTLITGIAAQTLASKRNCTPASDAVANSSAPRRATSCLFADTTLFPRRSASATYSPAGSMPPITSATSVIDGSSRICDTSSVSTPGSAGNSRSFPGSRTRARAIRTRWPVARSMSSAESIRRRLTAAPTVPYPRRPTGTSIDAMQLPDLASLQRPQPAADRLDLRRGEGGALLEQLRLARLDVRDELACERPVLHCLEDGAHVLAHVLVDHERPPRVAAVLGRVRDRLVHPLEPALVDEVDDQLELVDALPVRDLRLVAGLDEGLEAERDELRQPAAQHRLLAEEVALGLLREGRLDDPRAAGPDRRAVGERQLARLAARVGVHGEDRGRAVALLVEPAHDMTRALGRDHDDVVARRRLDAPEVHVQAVREEQRRAGLEVRLDVVLVDLGHRPVRDEDRDELRSAHRLRDGLDRQARLLGCGPGRAALAQPDLDRDAGVGEVQGVGVALAAVADHGNLAGEQVDVAVLEDLCHRCGFLSAEDVLAGGGRLRGRPPQGDAPGADDLADAVRADELFEGVDVVGAADDLEDEGVAAELGDARLEHLGEREQLGPALGRRGDGDQCELPLDGLARLELEHAEDVHELVHLLDDLLERVLVAVHAEGEARHVGPLGRADRQRLDVVAAPREELRDARERAGLVLELDGEGVDHAAGTSSSSGSSITSTAAA